MTWPSITVDDKIPPFEWCWHCQMYYHYVVNTSFKIASSYASTTMDGTHFLAYFEYTGFSIRNWWFLKSIVFTFQSFSFPKTHIINRVYFSNLKNRFLIFSILMLKKANSNMGDPVKDSNRYYSSLIYQHTHFSAVWRDTYIQSSKNVKSFVLSNAT